MRACSELDGSCQLARLLLLMAQARAIRAGLRADLEQLLERLEDAPR